MIVGIDSSAGRAGKLVHEGREKAISVTRRRGEEQGPGEERWEWRPAPRRVGRQPGRQGRVRSTPSSSMENDVLSTHGKGQKGRASRRGRGEGGKGGLHSSGQCFFKEERGNSSAPSQKKNHSNRWCNAQRFANWLRGREGLLLPLQRESFIIRNSKSFQHGMKRGREVGWQSMKRRKFSLLEEGKPASIQRGAVFFFRKKSSALREKRSLREGELFTFKEKMQKRYWPGR